MSANLLSLNQSKTEFLLIGLPQQLSKVSDPTLFMPSNETIMPTNSAHNLGVIFDSSLSFSEHISSVSKACFLSIRDLCRIRKTLDNSTAQTIAMSLNHSKIDYRNSLLLNLPCCQLDRLQLILNSAARVVSKTPCFSHISPILKSLHWLKVDQRIQYKVLSLTYKTLQSQKLSMSTIFSTFNLTLLLVHHHSSASASQLSSQNNRWIFYLPCSGFLEQFT